MECAPTREGISFIAKGAFLLLQLVNSHVFFVGRDVRKRIRR